MTGQAADKMEADFESTLADLQSQVDADFGNDKPAVETANLVYTVGAVGKDLSIWIVAVVLVLIALVLSKKL